VALVGPLRRSFYISFCLSAWASKCGISSTLINWSFHSYSLTYSLISSIHPFSHPSNCQSVSQSVNQSFFHSTIYSSKHDKSKHSIARYRCRRSVTTYNINKITRLMYNGDHWTFSLSVGIEQWCFEFSFGCVRTTFAGCFAAHASLDWKTRCIAAHWNWSSSGLPVWQLTILCMTWIFHMHLCVFFAYNTSAVTRQQRALSI
jgi:hypothetical protein